MEITMSNRQISFSYSLLALAAAAFIASPISYSQGLIFDEDISGSDLITELNTTDGTAIRQFFGPDDLEAMAPGVTPDVLGSDASAREIDTLEAFTNIPLFDLAAGNWQGTLVNVGGYLRFFERGARFSRTWDDSGRVLPYPGYQLESDAGVGGDIQPSTGYMFTLQSYGTDTIYVHSLPDGSLVNTITSDVTDLQALTFAGDGTLYAVTRDTNSLYTLDPATGAGTLIAGGGTLQGRLSGLEYVAATGTLYGTTSGDHPVEQALVRIDVTTGVDTVLTYDGMAFYDRISHLESRADGSLFTLAKVNIYDSEDSTVEEVEYLAPVSINGDEYGLSYPDSGMPATVWLYQGNFWPNGSNEIVLLEDEKMLHLNSSSGELSRVSRTIFAETSMVGGDIQPSSGHLFSLQGYGTDTIYVHSLSDGALVATLTSDVTNLQALTFSSDGTLYAVTRSTNSLYTLDPATGAGTLIAGGGTLQGRLSGLEYVAATGTLYGTTSGNHPSPQSIVTIDTSTGVDVVLSSPGVGAIRNLTSNDAGLFTYAANVFTSGAPGVALGGLAEVNLVTGTVTRVGGLPIEGYGQQRGNFWVNSDDTISFISSDRTSWGGVYSNESRDLLSNTAVAQGAEGGDIQPSSGHLFSLQSYGTDTIYVHSLPDGALVNTLTSDVTDLQALTFAGDGTLYAVTRDTNSLYTLDPSTGAGTLVGSAGALGMRMSGLEYLDSDSTLYATTSGNSPYPQSFVAINTTNAAVTVVSGPFGESNVRNLASDSDGKLWTFTGGGADFEICYPAIFDPQAGTLTYGDGTAVLDNSTSNDGFPITRDNYEALASSRSNNRIYASDSNEYVDIFNLSTGAYLGQMEADSDCNIESMAVDEVNNKLYAGCDSLDYIVFFDLETNTVSDYLTSAPDMDDGGMAIDSDGGFLYFIEESGEVHKITLSDKAIVELVDLDFSDSSSEVGATFIDHFIGDIAVRLDSDGDGAADQYEEGYSAADTDVLLDDYPFDNDDSMGVRALEDSEWQITSQRIFTPADTPEGYTLATKLVEFCAEKASGPIGETMVAELYFSEEVDLSGLVWLKRSYSGEWYEYDQVEVSGNSVHVTLVDGGSGDADLTPNNRICDPIGGAIPDPDPTPVPAIPLWILLAIAAGAGIMGARRLQKAL